MPEIELAALVENRLVSTAEVLKKVNSSLIETTIEEVKAVYGFEEKEDDELSVLQKSYIADLVAAAVLKYGLDRYKEDANAKTGPDTLVHEAQDKLKYLTEQINRFEKDAKLKAGKLGLDLISTPALVVKIGATVETDE